MTSNPTPEVVRSNELTVSEAAVRAACRAYDSMFEHVGSDTRASMRHNMLAALRAALPLCVPVGVDEAMVERAMNARFDGYDVAVYLPEYTGRSVMRAALEAALSSQPGGSDNDR